MEVVRQVLQAPSPAATSRPLINQPSTQALASDKRLQELRSLALEYVKQIVVRAAELAHERRSVKLASSEPTYSEVHRQLLPAPLEVAAARINQTFKTQLGAGTGSQSLDSSLETQPIHKKQPPQHKQSDGPTEPKHDNANRQHTAPGASSRNRISWALIMSCFSTCLPSTFTDTVSTLADHRQAAADRPGDRGAA